jgi:hypothetical protein
MFESDFGYAVNDGRECPLDLGQAALQGRGSVERGRVRGHPRPLTLPRLQVPVLRRPALSWPGMRPTLGRDPGVT